MGVPGKLRRSLNDDDQKSIRLYAERYLGYKENYLSEFARQ